MDEYVATFKFWIKHFRAGLEEKLNLTKNFYNEKQKATGFEVELELELSVAIYMPSKV